MDIMNRLSPERFREVDDVLAFISIYDDVERAYAYRQLLYSLQGLIQNAVCVEAGCGFGWFSAEMARLGARKVYAVEQNAVLVEMARERLAEFPQIEVIHSPIQDFIPPEPVDFLLHEFYGQLLYDEDLHYLNQLKFQPRYVAPNGGELLAGIYPAKDFTDSVVTLDVLQRLDGVLISGLFDDTEAELAFPVMRWRYGQPFDLEQSYRLPEVSGELLAFGVQISHDERPVCRAGVCENWSYVWTYRSGEAFQFTFYPGQAGEEVGFTWLDPAH